MKILFLILCLLALPALAGPPVVVQREAIGSENLWMQLQFLMQSDDDHITKHLGVKFKVPSRVRNYIAQAQAGYDAYVNERIGYLCKNRAVYDNDPAALAQFWEDLEAGKTKQRDKIAKGLEKVLDPEELASFKAYAESAQKITVHGVDRAATLRSGAITAQQYTDRACGTVFND